VTSDESHGCYCHPEALEAWAADATWHVVKTHEVLDGSHELVDGGGARILYIYRDLRDVAVSMKRAFSHRGDELIAAIDRAVATYESLDTIRAASDGKVLWSRYEEAYADLPRAIGACARFLDLAATPAQVAAVYEQCRVETAEAMTADARGQLARTLQQRRRESPGRADALREQVRDRGWLVGDFLLHHHHISSTRGAPGSWEGALTAGEIDAIGRRFGPWLAAQGYTTEAS